MIIFLSRDLACKNALVEALIPPLPWELVTPRSLLQDFKDTHIYAEMLLWYQVQYHIYYFRTEKRFGNTWNKYVLGTDASVPLAIIKVTCSNEDGFLQEMYVEKYADEDWHC